jgi:hypothetical protein
MPNQGYKQSKLDPKKLAQWWQEAEEQIRLAHPHESKKNQQLLTEKYVQAMIQDVLKKQKKGIEPREELIAHWYRTELVRLRSELPETPLKEREDMAAKIVSSKIKQYRRTIRLDTFFNSNE